MTRALDIDFAAKPRAGAWMGWVVLVAGIVAAGAALTRLQALEQAREQLEAQSSAIATSHVRRPATRTERAKTDGEERRSAARRALAVELGRPWDGLFDDIEGALRKDIALLAIEPDVRKGQVRIVGEARDAQALATYLAALEGRSALARVGLVQHERVAKAGPDVLRFTVVSEWTAVRK